MIDTIDTRVAMEAKDLLPETWVALAEASSFGPAALERRHNAVIELTFNLTVDDIDLNELPYKLIAYLGMRLALVLLDPGIEYWSRQIIGRTVGDRESSSYKDRAEDLRLLKKEWTTALAGMWPDVQQMLPLSPGRAGDAPRVAIAGELPESDANPRTGLQVVHTTANPYDLPPAYGPPEENITGA